MKNRETSNIIKTKVTIKYQTLFRFLSVISLFKTFSPIEKLTISVPNHRISKTSSISSDAAGSIQSGDLSSLTPMQNYLQKSASLSDYSSAFASVSDSLSYSIFIDSKCDSRELASIFDKTQGIVRISSLEALQHIPNFLYEHKDTDINLQIFLGNNLLMNIIQRGKDNILGYAHPSVILFDDNILNRLSPLGKLIIVKTLLLTRQYYILSKQWALPETILMQILQHALLKAPPLGIYIRQQDINSSAYTSWHPGLFCIPNQIQSNQMHSSQGINNPKEWDILSIIPSNIPTGVYLSQIDKGKNIPSFANREFVILDKNPETSEEFLYNILDNLEAVKSLVILSSINHISLLFKHIKMQNLSSIMMKCKFEQLPELLTTLSRLEKSNLENIKECYLEIEDKMHEIIERDIYGKQIIRDKADNSVVEFTDSFKESFKASFTETNASISLPHISFVKIRKKLSTMISSTLMQALK